jgi:hypothetical protein
MVNEELEIDTVEGNELFIALTNTLFEQFMKYKKKDEDAA